MRAVVTAFALGTAAVFALLLVGGFALGVAAQTAHWQRLELGVGPIRVFEYVRHGRTTSTTFGPGLAVAAVAGGLLNALAAGSLRLRRARG